MTTQGEKFLQYIKQTFPSYFQKSKVLSAGEYNSLHVDMFKDSTFYSSDLSKDDPHIRKLISYKYRVFPKNTFDITLSIDCLHHDINYSHSFKTMYEMLIPDGIIVIECEITSNTNIHNLNNILELDKSFSYWNCYQTSDNLMLFIGIKMNITLDSEVGPQSFVNKENNTTVVSIKNTISQTPENIDATISM
tara:strand:+ start:271 stop:846 length:576 start_codon:yes stop_codon:yes gene_type:complete